MICTLRTHPGSGFAAGLHLYLVLKRRCGIAGFGECSAVVLVVDDHGMGGDLRSSTSSEPRDCASWHPCSCQAACLHAHCAASVTAVVAAAAPHAPALTQGEARTGARWKLGVAEIMQHVCAVEGTDARNCNSLHDSTLGAMSALFRRLIMKEGALWNSLWPALTTAWCTLRGQSPWEAHYAGKVEDGERALRRQRDYTGVPQAPSKPNHLDGVGPVAAAPCLDGKGFKTACKCHAQLRLGRRAHAQDPSGARPIEQERAKDMRGSPRNTLPCAPRPSSSYTSMPWRAAAASVPSSAPVEWREHRMPAHTQRSGRSTSNWQRQP